MSDDSDAALVFQCRGGDRQAFEVLLTRYERQVFGAAFRILNNREDATDVTQTAFLRAYEHLDRYDPDQPFSSWVYRIAVNEALDLVRGRQRSEPLLDDAPTDWPGPDAMATQEENAAAVQNALMALNIDYRTLIVLKHFQECSYEEIALVLEIPVKTVKSRLFTARQALREEMAARGLI